MLASERLARPPDRLFDEELDAHAGELFLERIYELLGDDLFVRGLLKRDKEVGAKAVAAALKRPSPISAHIA